MFITRTAENGIQVLLFLAMQSNPGQMVPLTEIAKVLGGSPTYLSKVGAHLAKAGLVRSQRGVSGGLQLARPASQITLLDVVESCQGILAQPYCTTPDQPGLVACGFHLAMFELRETIRATLAKHTLEEILASPNGKLHEATLPTCHMAFAAQLANLSAFR